MPPPLPPRHATEFPFHSIHETIYLFSCGRDIDINNNPEGLVFFSIKINKLIIHWHINTKSGRVIPNQQACKNGRQTLITSVISLACLPSSRTRRSQTHWTHVTDVGITPTPASLGVKGTVSIIGHICVFHCTCNSDLCCIFDYICKSTPCRLIQGKLALLRWR